MCVVHQERAGSRVTASAMRGGQDVRELDTEPARDASSRGRVPRLGTRVPRDSGIDDVTAEGALMTTVRYLATGKR
jgi:hypothetical protein